MSGGGNFSRPCIGTRSGTVVATQQGPGAARQRKVDCFHLRALSSADAESSGSTAGQSPPDCEVEVEARLRFERTVRRPLDVQRLALQSNRT